MGNGVECFLEIKINDINCVTIIQDVILIVKKGQKLQLNWIASDKVKLVIDKVIVFL